MRTGPGSAYLPGPARRLYRGARVEQPGTTENPYEHEITHEDA